MKTVSFYHTLRTFASSIEDGVISFFTKFSRPIYWAPVFLGLGIGLYFSLSEEPDLLPSLLISGFLGSFAFVIRRSSALRFMITALFLISLGFSTSALRTALKSTPLLEEELPPRWIEGVLSKVEELPAYQRITLRNVPLTFTDAETVLPSVRIGLRGRLKLPLDFLPGDRIRLRAVLLPPPGPVAPEAYDFRQRAFFEKISAVGYALTPGRKVSRQEELSLLTQFQQRVSLFRHQLTLSLRNSLGDPAGHIAAALVTGDRSGISDNIRNQFANAGTAHLLAISGLHLSIVAGFFFLFIRLSLSLIPPLSLRFLIKKWAAGAALLGTAGYLLICGAPLPAQRAFFMSSLVLGAVMIDRTALTLRNICLAAFIILLFLPESLLSVSFQLSFAATLALVATYEAYRDREKISEKESSYFGKLKVYFGGVAATSLIATLATTPFIVQTFHKLTLHAVSANLIAVPWTSFVLIPLLLLYLFFLPLGEPEILTALLKKTIHILLEISQTVSQWPGAVILMPPTSHSTLLLLVGGGLWICLVKKKMRFLGLPPIAFSVFLWAMGSPPPDLYISGDLRVIALRSDDGTIYLPSRRGGRFARESFQSLTASQKSVTLPLQAKEIAPDLTSLGNGRYQFKDSLMVTFSKEAPLLIENERGEPLFTHQEALASQGTFLWIKKGDKDRGSSFEIQRGTTQNRPWSIK